MPRHIPVPPELSAEKVWTYVTREPTTLKQIEKGFPTAEALNDINVTTPADTTERILTVALPTNAVIKKASLIAIITAMNNAAVAAKIDIDVKGRKGVGSWSTFFSQLDCIGFGAVDGATTSLVALQDVSTLVDAVGGYGFKCTVTLSDAHSVRFTTQYVLVVVYELA